MIHNFFLPASSGLELFVNHVTNIVPYQIHESDVSTDESSADGKNCVNAPRIV